VARWDFQFCRAAHPAAQVPFYLFGSLSLFIYAFQNGKRWAFLAGALFFSIGFYIYEAYKAFPLLLLLYLFYEYRSSPSLFKKRLMDVLATVPLVLILTAPWAWMGFKSGSLGGRERDLFLFPGIFEGGTFLPLAHHLARGLLMFNARGDDWFLQNLPGHRMLDDVTGFLFFFGVLLAVKQLKKRTYFYALAGFTVMSLPALLTLNPIHAARMFGTVPFIAFLCALSLKFFRDRLRDLPFFRYQRRFFLLLSVLLGWATFQNTRVYFVEQARDHSCWRGNFVEATTVGKAVARYGGDHDIYLSSRFYGHYTVMFLGYFHLDRVKELKSTLPDPSPGTKGLLFALEEGRTGVLHLLEALYPGGETEIARDPDGHAIVYFYRVPADKVEESRKKAQQFLGSDLGLRGEYRRSTDWKSPVSQVQLDPVLNFTFRNDFPLRDFPPLAIHWKGFLVVPTAGSYRFLILTTDSASIKINEKAVVMGGDNESKDILLAKGKHPLDVYFLKSSGTDTALSLLWKKPGDAKFEVVPHTALKH
jgi:hypothetical protein